MSSVWFIGFFFTFLGCQMQISSEGAVVVGLQLVLVGTRAVLCELPF